ncbi:MAG: hypothetical protein AUG51_11825 [Acidobacteria bacterium 13_1_20CM_3_53_8]|nr:MAG: hypothetical protein AUG51_11825 [Acidobacteria bacterium 13_1_20CM_3_53_8]
MGRIILVTVLGLLLTWSAAIKAVNRPMPESLSPADRAEVFETVWKTINNEYYNPSFNGVDWAAVREHYRPQIEAARTDDAFYALIKQMLRELHDLHTGFAAPNDQPLSTGLSVNEVEGKLVVVRVEPDSEAARSGVKVGMIVRTFDGKPVEDRLAQLRAAVGHSSSAQADRFVIYNSFLTGPANAQFKLGLEREDGTQFETTLKRSVVSRPSPSLISQRLPSGFYYMKINTLRSPVDEQFKSTAGTFMTLE